MIVIMKRKSLSCVAVLASVAALAGVGPAGWAAAGELPESGNRPAAASSQVNSQGGYAASVTYRVGNGIWLGTPKVVADNRADTLELLNNVGEKGAGYRFTWGGTATRQNSLDVRVQWPILKKDGSQTDYTATSEIRYFGPEWGYGPQTTCVVRDSARKNVDHLRCAMDRRGGAWDWNMHITDTTVNRLAEASGSVKTDDSVSLDTAIPMIPGGYTTESQLRIDGADVVPTNSSTQFDAVLRTTDVTPPNTLKEPDTARMKFKYAIRDADQPGGGRGFGPQYYVRGEVSNQRGSMFKGGSSCEIIDYLGTVVENSGYSCTMDGYYDGSVGTAGRAQYITDFTIGKKK
jgi:hypothetical protein